MLYEKGLCPARLLHGVDYLYFRDLVRSLVRLVQVDVGKETDHRFVARTHGSWVVSSGILTAAVFSVDDSVTCHLVLVTQKTGGCDLRALTLIAHLGLGSTRLLRRRVGDAWERARP